MNADLSPFHPRPAWQRWLGRSAGFVSVGIHVLLGAWLATRPEAKAKVAEWVEVAINRPPPPPPPPEPEPTPEPEKAKPKPRTVEFKEIPTTPPPEAPPPTAEPKPRRLVQGLSANSFSSTGTSGFSARAGNTTAVAAGSEKMTTEEATGPYGARYTEVLTQPKLLFRPELTVTDEARKAGVQGRISVLIDLDAAGKPARVRVAKGLGYGLDEACQAAWMQSRWKPARNDDAPVAVSGIPQICSIVEVE